MGRAFQISCLCSLLGLLALAGGSGAVEPRYVGRTTGGDWIRGERLSGWHRTGGNPELDGRPLLASAAPIRWLLDQKLPLARTPESFIETTCGDRLPGVVVGFAQGDELAFEQWPAHFIVETGPAGTAGPALRAPTVRVIARYVQRIVWQPIPSRRLRPRTLFLRDGGLIEFRAARFSADSVTVLLEQGSQRLRFAEIAELHLDLSDSWESHLDELSILSPDPQARMLQISATTGLRATASLARFEAAVRGDPQDSDRWLHAVQPAWSLDLIWVRHADLRLRCLFAPDELPLTRIRPASCAGHGELPGKSWPWQRDTNVLGGPLRSGGKTFGWGFGVHAEQHLSFPLPSWAIGIEAAIGLDHTAGAGGCARGLILLGGEPGQRLFASRLLVGSQQAVATGPISLPQPRAGHQALVLVADAAPKSGPAEADPWEVRDFLVWGDPLIKLQPQRVSRELGQLAANQIAAWRGWTLRTPPAALYGVNVPANSSPGEPRFEYAVGAKAAAVELTRRFTFGQRDRWLVVSAALASPADGQSRLALMIDDGPAVLAALPEAADAAEPIVFTLPADIGGKSMQLRLKQLPESASPPVLWRGISISSQHPSLICLLDEQLPATSRQPDGLDAFSGGSSLALPGGASFELPLGERLPIRETPGAGEYRLLRLALRQHGQGGVRLELQREGADEPWVIEAGPDARSAGETRAVWSRELPNRWLLITRDLSRDFGECQLTRVTIRNMGVGLLLLDHVYVARRQSDFVQVETE